MGDIEIDNIDTKLKTTGTNTNPFSQVGIINKETKKKPHNITIKNNNPNEPKMNINMKYSDKQKYRRYRTKTEPKLFSKIMIDEEDDIVKTIKKAFGMEDKRITNMTNVETSGIPYYEEPNPIQGEEPKIVEMIRATEPTEVANIPAGRMGRRIEPSNSSMITRSKSVPKKTASIATEITGDIAQPLPVLPSELLEEHIKKADAEAEAADRTRIEAQAKFDKGVEEANKKREEQDEISRKKLAEIDERERKRVAEMRRKDDELINKKASERTPEEKERVKNILSMRKAYQDELRKYIGLTTKEREVLDYQFNLTGHPPDVDSYGKTPKDREKMLFWSGRR